MLSTAPSKRISTYDLPGWHERRSPVGWVPSTREQFSSATDEEQRQPPQFSGSPRPRAICKFQICRSGGHHTCKGRSEEHTSELQSHSFISYAVFCLKKKK